ncbi:MAG: cytochrome c oxidase assembly protein [Chloroflexota bacterium]
MHLALLTPLLAHAGQPDPTGYLFSNWSLQPGIALALFALIVWYVLVTGPLNRRRLGSENRPVTTGQRVAFFSSVVTLLVAVGPPLDDWSDHYLLLAHMVQHMLLMLLAPALFIIGVPGWVYDPLVRNKITNRIGYWITRPIVALLIFSVTLVIWHIPSFYEAALYSDFLHSAEHGMFFLTSLIAWWPILGSVPEWPRANPLVQCLYFFGLSIISSIVGAFITYSAPGLYRPYDTAPRVFGIGVETDQQLAGLLMWVIGGLIYLILITYTFLHWWGKQEEADRAAGAAAAARNSSAPSN